MDHPFVKINHPYGMLVKSKDKKDDSFLIPGLAILGCIIVGIMGVAISLNTNDALGLIASAIAFGAIVVVSFK
jgi:hypothetical protein